MLRGREKSLLWWGMKPQFLGRLAVRIVTIVTELPPTAVTSISVF
jgi:hypothetical protein